MQETGWPRDLYLPVRAKGHCIKNQGKMFQNVNKIIEGKEAAKPHILKGNTT